MIVEFTIETVDLDVALKINNSLMDDYNINLYEISFPSKNVYNDTEKIYVIIKEEHLFLDIINAIKNVFMEYGVTIHHIDNTFTSKLIKMLINDDNLNNFFNSVDLSLFNENDIIEITENEMSIDDILDRISSTNKVTIRDTQLIQLKN